MPLFDCSVLPPPPPPSALNMNADSFISNLTVPPKGTLSFVLCLHFQLATPEIWVK